MEVGMSAVSHANIQATPLIYSDEEAFSRGHPVLEGYSRIPSLINLPLALPFLTLLTIKHVPLKGISLWQTHVHLTIHRCGGEQSNQQ